MRESKILAEFTYEASVGIPVVVVLKAPEVTTGLKSVNGSLKESVQCVVHYECS